MSLCHISGNTVHHLPSWTRWWFEDARLISEPSEHTLLGRSFVDRLESFRTKWDIPGFVLAMTASPAFTHGGEEWKQEVYSFGQAKGAGDNVTEDVRLLSEHPFLLERYEAMDRRADMRTTDHVGHSLELQALQCFVCRPSHRPQDTHTRW